MSNFRNAVLGAALFAFGATPVAAADPAAGSATVPGTAMTPHSFWYARYPSRSRVRDSMESVMGSRDS